MTNWKNLEPILNMKAKGVRDSLIYSQKDTTLGIKYYYCDAIMDLVKFIREKTKAKELGATHHVLKALFRWIIYQDRARLEISKDGHRVDIYVDETRQEIEVKTISQMKVLDLWKKAIGVIEAPSHTPDSLWIFYFYRLDWSKDKAVPKRKIATSNGSNTSPSFEEEPTCHYLLVFVDIDLLVQESNSLKQDMIQLVEESLEHVAKKIRIRPELIIPLENLIKVEDVERERDEIRHERDQAKLERDQAKQVIQDKDQVIQDKDQVIQDKDKIIQQLKTKHHNQT